MQIANRASAGDFRKALNGFRGAAGDILLDLADRIKSLVGA
jgi:hypothetical protein